MAWKSIPTQKGNQKQGKVKEIGEQWKKTPQVLLNKIFMLAVVDQWH